MYRTIDIGPLGNTVTTIGCTQLSMPITSVIALYSFSAQLNYATEVCIEVRKRLPWSYPCKTLQQRLTVELNRGPLQLGGW